MKPTVKPLEWRLSEEGWQIADTVFGGYRVERNPHDRWCWGVFFHGEVGVGLNSADSFEAAKAAAQADFESRVLSALSVPAAAVVGEPVAWLAAHKVDPKRLWLATPNEPEDRYWSAAFPVYRAAPSAPDGWQPIETAPKEMEPLLLWQEQWLNPVMGRWSDARNGWIEYGSRDIKANIATHWRPLPAPPALGGSHD